MKKILCLILSATVLLGCVTALSSCGKEKDDGAQISVYLGDVIYDFDPTETYANDNAQQLMGLMFEPLFSLNAKGKLKTKAAAKKYEVDEEERKITIQLRETYWSDGVRVTAEHYVYAWRQLLLDPNSANSAASLLYDIENALEVKNGTKSIYEFGAIADVYDVVITYREGADYKQLLKNLASVATAPIREDIKSLAPAYWTKSDNSIVTNGPFQLRKIDYETGDLVLERNVGYHQKLTVKNPNKKVTPDRLVSFFGVDGEKVKLSYSDISKKTVFFMGDTSLADRAANKKKAKVADTLSTYAYLFNTENPLFAIKEVRKALSLAIDRDAIVNAVTFGKAATGFLPETAQDGIYTKKEKQELISAQAKKAEAQALLADVDFTGISKSFTITVNDDEESLKIAELVSAAWTELGFEVEVKPVSAKASTVTDSASGEKVEIIDSEIQYLLKQASYGKRDFDVIALDWQMYSTDGFVGLASLTGSMNGNGMAFSGDNNKKTARANIAGWSNSEYDAYIAAAFNATDDNTRAQKLRAAEALLIEEAPVVPIMFNQNFAFVSKKLKKIDFNGLGNVVFTDAKQKGYKKYLPDED